MASRSSLHGLDVLNFTLADVQTGVGPFLAIYLAAHHWDEQRVGIALTVRGIAGIITQTPAGALVDSLRAKRALIGGAVALVAVGAAIIAVLPAFWPVTAAQVLIGGASSVFIPAVCAVSLGLVGRNAFDARQGRNQTWNSAGNVVAAITMGVIGYAIAERGVFVFVIVLAVATILALRGIAPDEIDHQVARGAEHTQLARGAGLRTLFRDRTLVIFLACSVMFHFANAAMLPLLGEMLGKGQGRSSMLFMSACVVTTQLVITAIASLAGRRAKTWGRKPVLLVAFAALPIRGVLYTLTTNTVLLVGIQVLDGIASGIFGVVSVLVIADLTRGSGRFNLTLGAITAAVGIGAALSQLVAGSIVHHWGTNVGFMFLAGVATVAFVLLLAFMPETRDAKPKA
ncbi:MAG TPA: MFS transporter [Kofleriaceae bacterium]